MVSCDAVRQAFVPEDVIVRESIGKGSNNRAFAATLTGVDDDDDDGLDVVLRVPRRGSDTQQRGSAFWESRCMLRAAELGVHPRVHRAWTARHAHREWPSGLYVVADRYDHDLDEVLYDENLRAEYGIGEDDDEDGGHVGRGILRCLTALADESMFLFDLKPANIVLRHADGDDAVDVRILDFGSDFCEWRPATAVGRAQALMPRCHVVDSIREAIRLRDGADVDARCAHILFAAMLVVTSANITYNLRQGRGDHRMDKTTRCRVHPLMRATRAYLASMQGRDVAILKHVLRDDDVRGVLRHYHGRRNSGTRRTFALATDPEAC